MSLAFVPIRVNKDFYLRFLFLQRACVENDSLISVAHSLVHETMEAKPNGDGLEQNRNGNVKIVDDWIAGNVQDLAGEELVQTFDQVLQQIQKRILMTLSDVTLSAILDRVLFQTQKAHPLLNCLKINESGLSLKTSVAELAKSSPHEIIQAFRFYIIELMNILENLTSGILNKPLQKLLVEFRPRGRKDRGDQ